MKKFRFLFVVAVVVVFALSLSLIAGATGTPTAETYEQVYVGEYTSTETPTQEGVSYTGEAYVIFGKVTGSEQAGIILEKYATTDRACTDVLETKYFGARDGRISENGEFAIALYNVADGYYQAKVVAGDYSAPSAEGEYVKFSKGVATVTANFYLLDGENTVYTYTVPSGGKVVPPVVEREGYALVGWVVNPYKAHNEAIWGWVPENKPEYFANFDSDRSYYARWAYVGEEGDAMAPDTFKLTMKGYSKFSVAFDGFNKTTTIPAGSVGIMSFDVLENATGSVMGIGLANTSSEFWWLATNGDTADTVFAPVYHNGNWYEYNDMTNLTASTSNHLAPQYVLKEGNSVKLVYKPYEADDNLGWLRAYVKTAGSDEYVLFAGWEGFNAAQGLATSMPALMTGNASVGSGDLIVPLANCHVGIDADGDYTTTEDFTDMGVGISANSYDKDKDNKYVIIDPSYVHSSQYKYTFVDGNKSSNANTMFVAAGTVNRNDYAVDDGEYLEMKFTVLDSNIDEIEQTLYQGRISLGFGSCHATDCNNNFSGRHGYGMEIGLEDGEDATVFADAGPAGNSQYNQCDTIEVTSYGVGMRTLLQPGTEILVVIALDLTDDGANTGYTQIYYKTTDMDDYDIAAEMNGVGNQVAMSAAIVNAYPMVWLRSNYVDNESTKLTTTIGSFSVATYDEDGNVTSKIGLLSPSVGGSGGQTVISYPAAK